MKTATQVHKFRPSFLEGPLATDGWIGEDAKMFHLSEPIPYGKGKTATHLVVQGYDCLPGEDASGILAYAADANGHIQSWAPVVHIVTPGYENESAALAKLGFAQD